MNFLGTLDLFATVIYLCLAVYIVILNPKVLVNRICSVFLLCFALLSITMIFAHNHYTTKVIALLVANITAPGWISFGCFFLWFILAFTGKKKILKNKWFYLLLLGPPIVILYKQWTTGIYIDFAKVYYGWRPVLSRSYWTYFFFAYVLTYMISGLYINFTFIKSTRNPVLKKQARISFICVIIALSIGILTDVIFVLAKINTIPNIGNLTLLIWAVGVVYAMAKYRFLTITPATAAENIISTMYDCLILLDLQGNIVTVNKAVQNLLGYTEKELKNVPLGTLFTAEELKEGLDKEIIKKGDVKNLEFLWRTKGGKELHVLFSGSLLRDEKGTVAGMVCIARDISENKKLEAERIKSKKLESLGILAGGIAHDFNNLLSVIMGNVSMVKAKTKSGTSEYKLLDKAEGASIKAADLAEKFITFSPGWLQMEAISAECLAQMVKKLQKQLAIPKEKVTMNITMPGNRAPVYGEENQMEQVLKNLFLNALEAIPEGGEITLCREEEIRLDSDNTFLLKEGKYAKLFIRDNGCGIPADHLEKIFDPYFSTKSSVTEKGVGLGLTICYAIIKKHKGHITVDSKEGEGTTVALYLPVFEPQP
ncbi:MAG: PAS domain S-box protein [bacterium]|nr:PAS domain S-box protein [bacterium]